MGLHVWRVASWNVFRAVVLCLDTTHYSAFSLPNSHTMSMGLVKSHRWRVDCVNWLRIPHRPCSTFVAFMKNLTCAFICYMLLYIYRAHRHTCIYIQSIARISSHRSRPLELQSLLGHVLHLRPTAKGNGDCMRLRHLVIRSGVVWLDATPTICPTVYIGYE